MKYFASILLTLLLAAPLCAQPGAALDKELHGLRAEVDALTAKVLDLEKRGFIDAVADLGCRPDDPAFDNAAVLNAAIRAGKIDRTLYFPGGAYYLHSTVYDYGKEGLCFQGQGLAMWNVAGEFAPHRRGNASVRFVYTGPPDQPAFRFQGCGHNIKGITVQRGWKGEAIERAGTVGIEFSKHNPGPPAGKHSFAHYSVYGFETGLYFKRSDNNVDSSTFVNGRIDDCETAGRCDNPQTCALEFHLLEINGQGKNVFSFKTGGKIVVTSLAVCQPRLVLDLPDTARNAESFTFHGLIIDNNAAGWRLVEMHKPGPLNLFVRGSVGNKATVGENPVVLKNFVNKVPAGYHTIDVELYGADSAFEPWREYRSEAK